MRAITLCNGNAGEKSRYFRGAPVVRAPSWQSRQDGSAEASIESHARIARSRRVVSRGARARRGVGRAPEARLRRGARAARGHAARPPRRRDARDRRVARPRDAPDLARGGGARPRDLPRARSPRAKPAPGIRPAGPSRRRGAAPRGRAVFDGERDRDVRRLHRRERRDARRARTHLLAEPIPKSLAQPDARHPRERVVTGPAGSVLVFNGHLWHSGRRNASRGPRRAAQIVIVRDSSPA